jgi:hypothetical protein
MSFFIFYSSNIIFACDLICGGAFASLITLYKLRHCEPVTDVTGVAIRFPFCSVKTGLAAGRSGLPRQRCGAGSQ